MAFHELHVRGACAVGILAREGEHLVGHVEADDAPRHANAPSADQYVRSGAGAEIDHGLALVEIGDRRRDATAERRGHGFARRARSLGAVERIAEDASSTRVADGITAARRARLSALRGSRVALAYDLTKFVQLLKLIGHDVSSLAGDDQYKPGRAGGD